MPKVEKLVIFDGNALLHRAYHALPPLTTGDGRLVNAAYGFTTIFLKVLKELKPVYVAVTFDRKEATFRHEIFTEYKAQREKKPQELYDQIDIIKDIVTAFGVPIFEHQGYEADDIIGTITKKTSQEGIETLVVTGDLDTLQLVDDLTSVYTLRKGLADTVIYTAAQVYERYGLKPEQLVEFRALKGDPSDNIPGVKGIGEKTAVELIKKFHNIDNLYSSLKKNDILARKLSPRLRELLLSSEKEARLARKLSGIVRNVPIDFSLESCRLKGFDLPRIAELFHALEFKSLLNRLPELGAKLNLAPPSGIVGKRASLGKGDYKLVSSDKDLSALIKKIYKIKFLAIDTETSGLDPQESELVGISLSVKPGEAYYLPVSLIKSSGAWSLLAKVLADNKIYKVAHNAKFDSHILHRFGLEIRGLSFDTLVAAYLLQSGERGFDLKSLVYQELGVEMTPIAALIGERGKTQKSMAELTPEEIVDYACADADYTLRLKDKLEPELSKQGLIKLFKEVEMPLVQVLIDMERYGVKVDINYLDKLAKKMKRDIWGLEKLIYKEAGEEFNVSSPKQLKEILFNKLKIPVDGLRHTKTGVSTAASELEKMRGLHPIIEHLFQYRELTKLLSTYVETMPELVNSRTGRVHSSFNQTVTATGRLSSSDPNLQNIPIRGEWGGIIRQAFIAEPGNILISADYSQIDLRMAAHLSGDKRMLEVFNKSMDVHAATASFIFGVPQNQVTPDQRRTAKEVNFGILYGMGAFGLAERTGLSNSEAKQFIDRYFKSFSRLKEWLEEVKEEARVTGEVRTLLGRRRKLPEINSGVAQVRSAAERMAINLPIQGTVADLMKVAMVKIHKKLSNISKQAKMIMQVHDELVFEVPEKDVDKVAKMVREEMENAIKLKVPVAAEVKAGLNWAEMKKL